MLCPGLPRGSSAFPRHFVRVKDPLLATQIKLPFLVTANQEPQSLEVKNSILLPDKVVNDTGTLGKSGWV